MDCAPEYYVIYHTMPIGCAGGRIAWKNGAWGMGHGAWGMGHGAWGMGHGAWGMGHGAHGQWTAAARWMFHVEHRGVRLSRVFTWNTVAIRPL